jgi:hypothetical protein
MGVLGSYDGPAILGRAGDSVGMLGSRNVPIQLQASMNANYDTSLLGYSVDSQGALVPGSSLSMDLNVTIGGRKVWRKAFLGLAYGGNYSRYARKSLYDGTNHQLNLTMGTRIGKKWMLATQVGAATSNRFVGGPSAFQTSEFEFLAAPTAELFDSRMYFIGNSTSATYNISSRQSVRVMGNGSSVRRRAAGLVDMTSYGGGADWVYRLDRRSSVGVSYVFNHFDFTKVFGESDVHTVGLHFSRRVGRDMNVGLGLSGVKQSTVGVRTVSLDPVLAAILGRSSGSEVFESNNLLYGYYVSLERRIQRSQASIEVGRTTTPGNGYFLTSINDSATARLAHSVTRDFGMNASVGYSKMASLGFASGTLKGWTGGGGFTYRVTPNLGFSARLELRTFDLRNTTFGRRGFRATVGITYFPREGLAGIW